MTQASGSRPPIRIAFILRVTAICTLVLLLIVPFGAGVLFMSVLVAPGCGTGFDPAALGMVAEDVQFSSAEFNRPTPAYFIPPTTMNPVTNGATVIVLPTGSSARGARIQDMLVYHDAGFAVLNFDGRGCVGGVGSSLGGKEADQVGDALAYLTSRPDVDADRIGVHGFSAGGAAAILGAARFPSVRAVVAVGNYADFVAQIDATAPANLGLLSPFFRFGAQIVYQAATGEDWTILSPIRVIATIPPRPVLLVYGSNEPSLEGARQMAALSGAALYEMAGAGHGNYLDIDGVGYRARLTEFMGAALR